MEKSYANIAEIQEQQVDQRKDESGTVLKPCPRCKSSEDLSIDSCNSLGITVIQCECGHIYQSKCFEENIGKHWNKHVKSYKADL